jgi:hypothetical protein
MKGLVANSIPLISLINLAGSRGSKIQNSAGYFRFSRVFHSARENPKLSRTIQDYLHESTRDDDAFILLAPAHLVQLKGNPGECYVETIFKHFQAYG